MRSITYVLCRKKSSAWGPIRSQFGEHVGPHQHAQHNLQWWRTCTEGRRWLPSRSNGDWRRSAHESDQATRTVSPDGARREPTIADVAIRCCRFHRVALCTKCSIRWSYQRPNKTLTTQKLATHTQSCVQLITQRLISDCYKHFSLIP